MAETISTRVYSLERDRDRFDRNVFGENGLEVRVDKVESRVDVMGAKLAVYAGLGSLVGGAAVAAIFAVVFH